MISVWIAGPSNARELICPAKFLGTPFANLLEHGIASIGRDPELRRIPTDTAQCEVHVFLGIAVNWMKN